MHGLHVRAKCENQEKYKIRAHTVQGLHSLSKVSLPKHSVQFIDILCNAKVALGKRSF